MHRSLRTLPERLVVRPWLLAFVPINAAAAGFGVALPLLILLALHGAWTDVAVAAALFNAAVILASVAWGWIADRYQSRRALLLLNYGGFALLYAGLAEATSLPLVLVLYTLVGVLSPAGATAANLLVLERFGEAERPGAFASLQEMSILGAMGGLLVGYAWLLAGEPLAPLFLVLGALAAISVVAVLVGVREGPHRARVAHTAHHLESLAARLRVHPGGTFVPYFPHRPHLSREAWGRMRRWVRTEMHLELPLILLASCLFNLASNLFNISYVPYLEGSVGLGASAIFLVNFANNSAQALSYPVSGGLCAGAGADRVVQRSTYVRAVGYLAVAGFTFFPFAVGIAYGANVVAFGLLGSAIAFYSTASSMVLFRALEGRDAGRLLGLNSALGGVAAVGGALLAGVLAVAGSYRLTFLVAGGALLASLPLWTAVEVANVRRRRAAARATGTSPDPSVAAVAQTD